MSVSPDAESPTSVDDSSSASSGGFVPSSPDETSTESTAGASVSETAMDSAILPPQAVVVRIHTRPCEISGRNATSDRSTLRAFVDLAA